MKDSRSPKSEWVMHLPAGPPMKDELAALVDADGARDATEVDYYEAAADPVFVQAETARRRFRAQFRVASGICKHADARAPRTATRRALSCHAASAGCDPSKGRPSL